jgi:hypothetical protein
MYADRIPSKNAQSKAMEASRSVNKKTTDSGLAPNLKKHMWTRLRRMLSNTTSYYRKSGMRPPQSPAEECKRLRSDPCCFNVIPYIFCRSRLMMQRDQLPVTEVLGDSPSDSETLSESEIVSESELERVLLTVAAAILNPSTLLP